MIELAVDNCYIQLDYEFSVSGFEENLIQTNISKLPWRPNTE